MNSLINFMDIFFWIIYMLNIPRVLHIMQLESYQNDGMYRWMIANPKKAFKPASLQLGITAIGIFVTTLITQLIIKNMPELGSMQILKFRVLMMAIIFLIPNVIAMVKAKKELKSAKKPLKYTSRAKRLYFNNFIILIILEVCLLNVVSMILPNEIKALGYNDSKYILYNNMYTLIFQPLLFSFLIFTQPVNMIIANWFGSPTEGWINDRYINKARKKLESKEFKNLIRIGITGSYGKTSTKFILKTILSEKYSVYATPGSYNTTMGNVRVIREELKPEHQVFISEMGARKRYDVQEICQFVKPQIGIITSIGPQHLETFKKIENVAKTKGELLKGTAIDGAIFLPKDNSHCLELYKKDPHENKFLYSIKEDGSDIYAKNIKVTNQGSTFTVVYKNEEFDCETKLLGEHNVQNIMGCVAIAKYLGLTNKEIQRGIKKIEPVEHRLQLLPSQGGTVVIDDAFNSNPVGSKMALDVMKQFNGRKIIITPGMVELGDKEYEYNKEFGKNMAKVVDIAILVGQKRSKPIEEGLKENKFNKMNIYVVNTLDEASKKLAEITKAGDVILFENDLPDNYDEAK